MASSNAYAAPAALIVLIRAAMAANSPTSTVPVLYAFEAKKFEREAVWGGDIRGNHDPNAMRGGGNRTRAEVLTWTVHVRVRMPGGTPEEAAARALVIGAVVENTLAVGSAEDGASVTGLKHVGTTGFELANSEDDDAVICEIAYAVELKSILT